MFSLFSRNQGKDRNQQNHRHIEVLSGTPSAGTIQKIENAEQAGQQQDMASGIGIHNLLYRGPGPGPEYLGCPIYQLIDDRSTAYRKSADIA